MGSVLGDGRVAAQSISLGFLLIFVASTAHAEDQKKRVVDRIPFRFELRERFEGRQNFDLNSSRSDDNFPVLQRIRFTLAPQFGIFRFTAQVQDSTVWNKSKSPYTSANVHMHQLYLDAPLHRGFRIRAGRQELSLGEERLVGAFGWDNQGRTFDAVSFYREHKQTSLRFFAANLTLPRRTYFARGQSFFGAVWKRGQGDRSVEAYSLWLHDQTLALGEEGRGRTRVFTAGVRVTQPARRWKQTFEGALQSGKRNGDPHFAGALTYRGDLVWDVKAAPTAGLEYNWASGDGNRRDGKSREFHNLFPTNHPFYGYMDLFGWRNIHNPRFTFAIQPARRTRIEVSYNDFWLSQSTGAWKSAGGSTLAHDPGGRSGKRIGGEVDFLGSYAFSTQVKFLLGYSCFLPGKFARATRGGDAARFSYVQVLYSYR